MSSVARVTEIIASSKKSFDDAIDSGVKRATKTLKNVAGAWVASQDLVIAKGKIAEYRVRLRSPSSLPNRPGAGFVAVAQRWTVRLSTPSGYWRGNKNRRP